MRTVILTGSTGGLGQAMAERLFQEEDLFTILVFRNGEKFRQLFGEKKFRGKGFDIRNKNGYEELEELIPETTQELILVLNASEIRPIKRIGQQSREEILQSCGSNVELNVFLVNDIVRYAGNRGIPLRLISLDSGAADMALEGWSLYSAGKAFMNRFLAVLQQENPEMKIVCFDPGVIDTKMQEEIRAVSPEVFPEVGQFTDFKQKGQLKKPTETAGEIMDRYICSWKAEELRERGYQER